MHCVKALYLTAVYAMFIGNLYADEIIPENFDAREKWPECKSIGKIRDGGNCPANWAFAAVSTMSDRLCIQTGGTVQFEFSPQDLLSCCTDCSTTCDYTDTVKSINVSFNAMHYWIHSGIVSGGDYGSSTGCMPYSKDTALTQEIPACQNQCQSGYGKSYNDDKKFGRSYTFLSNETEMQNEIMTNGPLMAGFILYDDFLEYKDGVYTQELFSTYLGYIYGKILGWGEENRTRYWLVANSWGNEWGLNGYVKFLRGSNHLLIEHNVFVMTPSDASALSISLYIIILNIKTFYINYVGKVNPHCTLIACCDNTMKYLSLICVLQVISAKSGTVPSHSLIEIVNSQNASWKAGLNFPEKTHREDLRQRLGFLEKHPDPNFRPEVKVHKLYGISIPEFFDARDQWPNCKDIIGHIRDQGKCACSWAFAAVEVMSDRLHYATLKNSQKVQIVFENNGTIKFEFSAEDLMSCCSFCGRGCGQGYMYSAWIYWMAYGLVSGGDYNSNEGCKPYGSSAYVNSIAPECTHSCTNQNYENSYEEDLLLVDNYYNIPDGNVAQMQGELMLNGPIEVIFTVYEDLSYYKEGVYQHVSGKDFGFFAVKIIGWGTEDGVPYWLVANSWGTSWGNLNGYFKIVRGTN
ncbi:hypothetical protein Zmor_012435 [Zophobas morio]|uniref:Peptidase C1A papain C-terminal domain-containing protein n=1 Tax=Zophobas morio TaxID=2755281 RepID=A0AA38IFI2_9CUCU|nr:hypothetical protein Zmor_012435 [Zophobas morio]